MTSPPAPYVHVRRGFNSVSSLQSSSWGWQEGDVARVARAVHGQTTGTAIVECSAIPHVSDDPGLQCSCCAIASSTPAPTNRAAVLVAAVVSSSFVITWTLDTSALLHVDAAIVSVKTSAAAIASSHPQVLPVLLPPPKRFASLLPNLAAFQLQTSW